MMMMMMIMDDENNDHEKMMMTMMMMMMMMTYIRIHGRIQLRGRGFTEKLHLVPTQSLMTLQAQHKMSMSSSEFWLESSVGAPPDDAAHYMPLSKRTTY